MRVLHGQWKDSGIADDGFEAFWLGERDRVYRALVMTLADASLSAEAVDEAMLRAFERWERISGYDNPAAWVYRVALNWATSFRRKLKLRPTRSVEALDRPTRDDLPDVDLARRLRMLNRKHRTVLVARYYLQLTPDEIADALRIPAGTVKSRLHRAIDTLRDQTEVDYDRT